MTKRLAIVAISLACVALVALAIVSLVPIWQCQLVAHFRIHLAIAGVLTVAGAALARVRGYFDAAAVATIVQLVWLAPDLAARRSSSPEGGIPVRVLVFNVHTESSTFAEVRALIAEVDADVIGLVEVDRRWLDALAVVAQLGLPCALQPGAGAIYGPKLEFILRDRRGRPWQCGTIQLDFVMPQRFDVRYVAADGERRPVVMLHRALFGSIERFMGVLLEHHGAALPAWLAPEQVAVVPVSPDHRDAADAIRDRLVRAGLRARLDDADESLARRIAIAHRDGVPFVTIVGAREVRDHTLAVRGRDDQWIASNVEAIARLQKLCSSTGHVLKYRCGQRG